MLKLFRVFGPLAMVIALVMLGTPEVSAKKSGPSKNSKSKTQTHGNSKKASSRKRQVNKKRSPRERVTVAKSRQKPAPQTERDARPSPSSVNQSETPLTPNPSRNSNTNSSTEPESQESNQPPAPRAVISSIPIERVAEIQTALIKQGYLTGEATGIYDDSTKAAMKKYQIANNLQASGLPSAHALKKLGVSKRGNSLSQVPVKTKSDVEKEPQQN